MKSLVKFLIFFALLTLAACGSYDKVPYFQNYEYANSLNKSTELYDAKIMPKDILTIIISTSDPTASAHFNLGHYITTDQNNNMYYTAGNNKETYLVDNDGTIDFPVLGRINVAGKTRNECENMIKEKLKTYLKEVPMVMVRMPEFKITVLGEVNRPGQFTVSREKVNIYEALALAGDMTVYGQRDSIKILREDDKGKRHIYTINLSDATAMYDPMYQLQQNDILYVTPKKSKVQSAYFSSNSSIWLSSISLIVTLLSFGLTIYNVTK